MPAGIDADLVRESARTTPFMAAFLLRATAAIGRPELAVERLRALRGQMLDAGARTFWEEFDAPDRCTMYGRPFGKSHCHAWGAAPAALLPETVCGVRPVVPVPGGDIEVVVDGPAVSVRVPPGHALVRNGVVHEGPAEMRW